MSQPLSYELVEHNPSNKAITHAVIWLHGLGANGHDFVPIVPQLGLSDEVAVRFIFPHAPSMPITVNGGYVMPAWYDIIEMNLDRRIDKTQIQHSANQIEELIKAQLDLGIARDRIVIAGFSQGGAVAYHVALSSLVNQQPLAGLLALSTYFATRDEFITHPLKSPMPILIQHGDYDDVVPEVLGVRARHALLEMGLDATYQSYGMAHQVCQSQIKDIGTWLQTIFLKNA